MVISRRGFSCGLASLLLLLACLPVCAQKTATRSTLSNRANCSEIENPSALSGFFLALAETSSGRRIELVRVMHFGDSHAAADVLTAEIRGNLQSQFGDGGAGYIVPRNPMSTRRRPAFQSY